jgi:hypothetical protein
MAAVAVALTMAQETPVVVTKLPRAPWAPKTTARQPAFRASSSAGDWPGQL